MCLNPLQSIFVLLKPKIQGIFKQCCNFSNRVNAKTSRNLRESRKKQGKNKGQPSRGRGINKGFSPEYLPLPNFSTLKKCFLPKNKI